MKIRFILPTLVALILSFFAFLSCPSVFTPGRELPPGVSRAKWELISVWLCGDDLGCARWLSERARAYEAQTPGARVTIRHVTQEDISSLETGGAVMPRVLIFSLGERVSPALLLPLDMKEARCGQFEGAQHALPLCIEPYALYARAENDATVRPSTLFLPPVTPSPDDTAFDMRSLPPFPVGEDLACLCAALLSARGSQMLPMTNDQALAAFNEGQSAACVLPRGLAPAGAREYLSAPLVSDRALMAGIPDARGEDFLRFLLDDASQSLLPARVCSARTDAIIPNCFCWPEARNEIVPALRAEILRDGGEATAMLNRIL